MIALAQQKREKISSNFNRSLHFFQCLVPDYPSRCKIQPLYYFGAQALKINKAHVIGPLVPLWCLGPNYKQFESGPFKQKLTNQRVKVGYFCKFDQKPHPLY